MPRQRIDSFGAVGLNTDIGPTLLPENAVTSLSNVIPEGRSLRSAPGVEKLFDLTADSDLQGSDTWANVDAIAAPGYWEGWVLTDVTGSPPTRPDGSAAQVGDGVWYDGSDWVNSGAGDPVIWIEPLYHTAFEDPDDTRWLIVSNGRDVVAFTLEGVAETLTPAAGPWSDGHITFANLNGVLVVNSASDGPHYWPGSSGVLVQLPGPGDDAHTWLTGSGVPGGGTGSDGDYYHDTATIIAGDPFSGDWYIKVSGTWTLTTSVAGTVEYGWNWDEEWRCYAMAAYKYYLVALRMQEDVSAAPTWFYHKLRWSNSAAEGDLPAEWAILDTNDAGDDLIGETQGSIMGAAFVRDRLFIIKEDAVYEMSWIGGEYIMQVSPMEGVIGTRVPRGWASAQGYLALFSTADLLLFDGQKQISLTDDRVWNAISGIAPGENWNQARVHYHYRENLLFLAVIGSGYSRLTDVFVFDLTNNGWGHMKIQNGYGFDSTPVEISGSRVTLDSLSATSYADLAGVAYDAGVYNPSTPETVVYESNGLAESDTEVEYWVSLFGSTDTDYAESATLCSVSRKGIPVNGVDGLAQITRVWPELTGDAEASFRVGMQDTQEGDITWAKTKDGSPDFLVSAGGGAAIDPLITGRYIAWSLRSSYAGKWALQALTVEYQPAGEQ